MLADMKKGSIFALVINNNKSVDKTKRWCCSSVWLECLPVTQEVASSSLVSTAESLSFLRDFFVLYNSRYLFSEFSRKDAEERKVCPNIPKDNVQF